MNNLSKRKRIRLKDYDYSQNGYYFITICTHSRKMLFGDVGADSISARMVDDIWNKTILQYQNILCPIYVIMPNHFHCIVAIQRDDMESSPTAVVTIPKIIQSFKRQTTIEYIKLVKQNKLPHFENKIWQRSYHDHIIRDEKYYENIYNYIENNPFKWDEDCHNKANPKYKEWSNQND